MTVRTARFVAPFLAALTSSSALAQGEATDSVLAAACRADAQIVNTQSPDSLVSGALLRLAYCDVSGPPAVAKFWSVNADSTKWSVVLQVTPYLRDKRILDTVLAIAGRTSASVGLRRLALVGLVGLFQPGRSVPWDVALDPALDSLGGTFASSAVITPLTGAVAYPSGYRATIATLVKDVSLGESNTQLQSLASYIRRRLYWLDPTSTPLAGTGSVGVTYLCGNRFRIQNRDNFDMRLRYRVGETSDSGAIVLRAKPAGQSYSERVLATKLSGTLNVWFNSTLVQAKANGGTRC